MLYRLPLVVDLDSCLLKTDTRFEQIAAALAKPAVLLAALGGLLGGRAAFKARLDTTISLDVDALPVRENVVDWLAEQKTRGREIVLFSAANREVADALARRFPVFDRATKGVNEVEPGRCGNAHHLRKIFPDGFIYVGASRSDLEVWKAAAGIVLCGASPAMAGKARRLGKLVEAELPGSAAGVKEWARALRIHHWAKNLLIFVPAVLGNVLTEPQVLMDCLIGFALLALVTSSAYMLNDLSDLSADRSHWSKRLRPFAAGNIHLAYGFILPPIGIALGLLGGFFLSPQFLIGLLAYTVLTLAYSLALKRIPLLDTFTLAWLFTLRVVMGMPLAGSPYSPWLLCFALFLFFSLATAKRHGEMLRAAQNGSASLRARGYEIADISLALALGVASGMTSLVIMILYLTQEALTRPLYTSPGFLWALPGVLSIWLGRIWLLAHRGGMDDDPVTFALRDRPSLFLGAMMFIAFTLAVMWR